MAIRYFTSSRPTFIGNRRYAIGAVIPVAADRCAGHYIPRGSRNQSAAVVSIEKPSQYMTECDSRGEPLAAGPATAADKHRRPFTPPPAEADKPKRPFDKDI